MFISLDPIVLPRELYPEKIIEDIIKDVFMRLFKAKTFIVYL